MAEIKLDLIGSGDAAEPSVADIIAAARGMGLLFNGASPYDAIAGFWTGLLNGQDKVINVLGDSTGNDAPEWVRRLPEMFATEVPDVRVEYQVYTSGTPGSFPWPVAVNAGIAGERAVQFDGTRGRYLRHGDVATFTGSIDIRAKVNCADYSIGGVNQLIISKWSSAAGNRSFYWGFTPTGAMQFHWSPDGTVDNSFTAPASMMNVVDGADIWVRVVANASDGSISFYRSTDGDTWTLSETDSTTPFTGVFAAPTYPYELGSRGSTGSDAGATSVFRGKIYKLQMRDGVDGPIMNPQLITAWNNNASGGGANTLAVGSQTILISNASVAGAGLSSYWMEGRIDHAITRTPFPLLIVSSSHNEAAVTGHSLYTLWESVLSAIYTRNPTACVMAIIQNPELAAAAREEEHNRRIGELAIYFAKKGIGTFNVCKSMIDTGDLATLISADGIHPSTGEGGGIEWMAEYVQSRFRIGRYLAA